MSRTKNIPIPSDLAGPVRYRRAALGYPSIEAPDRVSGSYALGWLHAVDRPVQVHFSLLAAQGRLMEFLGDEPLTRAVDRATRFFNFTGDAERQAARLSTDARSLVEAYCRGFNLSLDRRRRPLLLRLLRVPRARMTAASSVMLYRLLAYFGLTSLQHTAELIVTELVARKAPRSLLELLLGDAAAGMDCESLAGLRFPPELSLLRTPHAAGSNAFAVAAEKSATGGALLMGEFHMQSGRFPPVLYAAHLQYADGEYHQGVGVPGLPFLAAGRTSRVAWSYTYGHADNVDVLAERCNGGRYQAGDAWKAMVRRIERVRVRGRSQPEEWEHHDNAYGTIAGDVSQPGLYPCVRWAGLADTASDLDGVLSGPFPRSAAEMAERHRSAKTLSLGAVIADCDGRIAYVQTGRIDARPPGWTGAYPRKGWDLESREPLPLSEDARPFVVDPPEGFVVSANEFNRGRQGQWWTTLPEPIYRWQRLREVLAAADRCDMNTLVRASYDGVDVCARRLMNVWRPLLPDEPEWKSLADWARQQPSASRTSDRAMMGLFHALHFEVVFALVSRRLPEELSVDVLDAAAGTLLFQFHLDQALALERPAQLGEAALREALAVAWPAAKQRVASGRWPVPARFAFVNEYFAGKLPRRFGFDTRIVEPPGGPTLPFQAREATFAGRKLFFAPAFHMVFDMSKPGGWFHIPGGASERRLGAGYGQGVSEWLKGRFFPLGEPQGPAPFLERPAAEQSDH